MFEKRRRSIDLPFEWILAIRFLHQEMNLLRECRVLHPVSVFRPIGRKHPDVNRFFQSPKARHNSYRSDWDDEGIGSQRLHIVLRPAKRVDGPSASMLFRYSNESKREARFWKILLSLLLQRKIDHLEEIPEKRLFSQKQLGVVLQTDIGSLSGSFRSVKIKIRPVLSSVHNFQYWEKDFYPFMSFILAENTKGKKRYPFKYHHFLPLLSFSGRPDAKRRNLTLCLNSSVEK